MNPFANPVEMRLYYNDDGEILFYTCEKPPGKYLVIDKDTYAQGRIDVRIIDNKIIRKLYGVLTKLVPDVVGIRCAKEDICIIVDDSHVGETVLWNSKTRDL